MCKFSVHIVLKPNLKNFEHYLASMWNECNCVVVWTFIGIDLLWEWNENGQGFVCALQESVSLVLWKFCNQIPLAFKVKFPKGSQSLCQISRLENLLWALELLQQFKNFFGIIVLQFLHCLFGGCVVGLTHHVSQVYCSQSPCHYITPLLACASEGDTHTLKAGLVQSLWGLWVLVHTRFCLSPLSISGGYGIWF